MDPDKNNGYDNEALSPEKRATVRHLHSLGIDSKTMENLFHKGERAIGRAITNSFSKKPGARDVLKNNNNLIMAEYRFDQSKESEAEFTARIQALSIVALEDGKAVKAKKIRKNPNAPVPGRTKASINYIPKAASSSAPRSDGKTRTRAAAPPKKGERVTKEPDKPMSPKPCTRSATKRRIEVVELSSSDSDSDEPEEISQMPAKRARLADELHNAGPSSQPSRPPAKPSTPAPRQPTSAAPEDSRHEADIESSPNPSAPLPEQPFSTSAAPSLPTETKSVEVFQLYPPTEDLNPVVPSSQPKADDVVPKAAEQQASGGMFGRAKCSPSQGTSLAMLHYQRPMAFYDATLVVWLQRLKWNLEVYVSVFADLGINEFDQMKSFARLGQQYRREFLEQRAKMSAFDMFVLEEGLDKLAAERNY